ncbi:succinate dehydrogenase, hydrophobic membrane anchor protein [Limibacillus halophilus]|jgi:succinate dehydrogenase / fumarate reductase membrane anchor subunit
MSLRTPLGKVRGLGSAKDGTEHFWMQRLTAVALVPLTLWFVISVIAHIGAGYGEFVAWLSSPLSGGLMILLLVATFYHAMLGLQVVIEDYVHTEWKKLASLIVMRFFCILLGVIGVLSVLKIML